jgi:flavin reductase (DIM6/NTAB) family NADH-FMN oxidoreductase RutF
MNTVAFNLRELPSADSYRLLVNLVVPRPIALVTSLNQNGLVNAAPFSFFNLMGVDPPVVALGIARDTKRPLGLKDTARNILQSGEFVVHAVNETIAEAMNICGTDFPPDMSEIEAAGFTLLPSTQVKPPRIAEAAAQMECRHVTTVEIGRTCVLLGEVIHLHINEAFYDAEKRYVKTEALRMVGRMHGRDAYVRTTDLFDLARPLYADQNK